MDRWPCQSEGLTARVRPDGRTEWVEIPLDCHGPMRPDWRRCCDCGFACRHWKCRCGREERDARHVCDPNAGSREVDQHRR